MIDTTKTIGTTETFDKEKISSLLAKGFVNSLTNLEKAIFCLEYLGQLQEAGLDLMFIGGSAVQLLLGDRWTRLSIDIDICTKASCKELEAILERIYHKFNRQGFAYTPRERRISGDIPFYLYRIETPTVTERGRIILLDVIGIRPTLATQQTPLKTFFFNSSIKVTTPTTGALLGDKLSIIGPTTVGRPLKDSRNGLEYAKHFCDIKFLQETDFDLEACATAYNEAINIQSKVRNKKYTQDECFSDMLFTCQVASLPQQAGEQAIEKLPLQSATRAESEFKILQDGLQRFRPFLVQKLSYSWDDLRNSAAQTALLAKIINTQTPVNKAREILDATVPTRKEDVLKIANKIEKLPKEERWFIIPEEIVNFPKILKTWQSYFFLNEII